MPHLGYLLLAIVLLIRENSCDQTTSPEPSIFNFNFFGFRPQISVSKFPPILEIIAQRIQQQFSNYIYEDLSRPPTWDRPTYKPYVPTTKKPPIIVVPQDIIDVEDEIIESTFEGGQRPITIKPSNNIIVKPDDIEDVFNGEDEIIESALEMGHTDRPILITPSNIVKIPLEMHNGNTGDEEIIDANFQVQTHRPPQLIFVDTYELINTPNFNSSIVVEYELKRKQLFKKHISKTLNDQVKTILQEHHLPVNSTRVYVKENCRQVMRNCNKQFKDVSSLFSDILNEKQTMMLNDLKSESNDFIVLTRIGKHIYLNTISLKQTKQN